MYKTYILLMCVIFWFIAHYFPTNRMSLNFSRLLLYRKKVQLCINFNIDEASSEKSMDIWHFAFHAREDLLSPMTSLNLYKINIHWEKLLKVRTSIRIVKSILVAQTKIAIGSTIFIVGKTAFHPTPFYSSFQAQLHFES